jgi:nucleotide-binding universal stress UspA family protein
MKVTAKEDAMFETILVATDGSETANRALEAAIELSLKHGARLYIVHIHLHGRPVEEMERLAEIEHIVPEVAATFPTSLMPRITMVGDLLSEAEHRALVVTRMGDLILQRAKQQAVEAGVERVETYAASGDYGDGILDAIDETGADLVVLGRRGLGRIKRLFLGSVSNKVVQHAGSAVLLIQ